jgi:membrane protein YqaA with SNARE-associated domain
MKSPSKTNARKHIINSVLFLIIFAVALYAAFQAAGYVAASPATQTFLVQFGYLGLYVISIFTGLGILPLPAATFTPILTAADLSLIGIIIALTLGTTTADILSFGFGHWSKAYVTEHYPKMYERVKHLYGRRRKLVIPFACFYLAFVPFPNEIILIPLAVLGMPLRQLLIPIIVGNVVNQTIMTFGISSLFWWLFP